MRNFTYTLKDKDGIHARPAGILIKAMQAFESNISITSNGKTINGKKLFALMALGIKQGTEIEIEAEGSDEEAVIETARIILEENL
jgi:phosphocarrier protein